MLRHSDQWAERSDAAISLLCSVIETSQVGAFFSHGIYLEVYGAGVKHEPVEDGIGEGGVSDEFM